MSYGKLSIVKTLPDTPNKITFAIVDENGYPQTIIPDIDMWLMERIGKRISIFISDVYFQIIVQKEKEKL